MKYQKKKKKNIGNILLYSFLGVAMIAALAGSAIAISRAVDGQTNSITSLSENTSSGNNSGSSSGGSQTGGNQGSSSGSQSGGDQQEESEEEGNSQQGQQHSEQITLNCSIGELEWNSSVQQGEMNETSFVATLNGLPSGATSDQKGLYIYCDDDDLGEWIEIYKVVNGSEVELNSPFHFQSGETIHLRQKKLATVGSFYKIPLWIFADMYDTEEVYHIIDVWIRTNA